MSQYFSTVIPDLHARQLAVSASQHSRSSCNNLGSIPESGPCSGKSTMKSGQPSILGTLLQYSSIVVPDLHARKLAVSASQHSRSSCNNLGSIPESGPCSGKSTMKSGQPSILGTLSQYSSTV